MRSDAVGAMEYLCGQHVPQGYPPTGVDMSALGAGLNAQFHPTDGARSIGAIRADGMGY